MRPERTSGLFDPTLGKIVLDAADAIEVGMEATAGRRLDHVEDVFAVAEGEEHRRDRTDLHRHVAEEQHHVRDARQLEEDGADVLRARRGFDIHQLFGREDERHFVGEAAQPVDAVDEGGHLRIGAHLGELFVAAVHVAHDRLGRHDLLTVELDEHAQRAVGRGVLRADVEGHALGLELEVDACVGCLRRDVAQLFAFGHGHAASPPSVPASASPSSVSPGICSTSTMPGHGLTMRANSGKSLRSGNPSNAPGK